MSEKGTCAISLNSGTGINAMLCAIATCCEYIRNTVLLTHISRMDFLTIILLSIGPVHFRFKGFFFFFFFFSFFF